MATESIFKIKCKGRNKEHKEVLKTPVELVVVMKKPSEDSNTIQVDARCAFIGGAHGGECRATKEQNVRCVYSVDLPYAFDQNFTHR